MTLCSCNWERCSVDVGKWIVERSDLTRLGGRDTHVTLGFSLAGIKDTLL
jgi:hypothetical protein